MQTIRENLATIVAGAVVALVIAIAFALFGPWHASEEDGLVAVVHDGDGNEHRLPLSQDATLEVRTDAGRNVVAVRDGTALMVEADCPHGSCLHQQPISKPGQQIVCLPHSLWVEIALPTSAGDQVGELDVDAVTWDDGASVDLVAR